MDNIPLAKPDIGELEKRAVALVLESATLGLGPKLKEFEDTMAKYVGLPYAIAVNSGTSALHLLVRSMGIGKDDEVITTPFSFIASANCILYQQARPVFVDINPDTLNIDVAKIEEAITPRTKAILAVDVFSHPADWEALQVIASRHKLWLIEDSAESLGSTYRGKPCGSFGDGAIFAFYPNKQITTGEGGMIVTRHKDIAEKCRSMANQGRAVQDGKWLEHVQLGYNYRLDEMSAAMGAVQLERLPEFIKKRNQVASWYQEAFQDSKGLELPFVDSQCSLSWFVYVVRLPKHFTCNQRDLIIQKMSERSIRCSNYFLPIHLQPFYKETFGYKEMMYPVCEDIGSRTIALPFFNALTKEQVAYVAENLKALMKEIEL